MSMSNMETHLFSFKVVIIGEPEVGKTSIIQQLKVGKKEEKYHRTSCFDFNMIEFDIPESNSIVDLYIFDTPGLNTIFCEPKEITSQIYKDAKCVVIVTDFSSTIEQISKSVRTIRKMMHDTGIVLITNKVDEHNDNVIQSIREERQIYCDQEGLESYFCSAETGREVKEIFTHIAKKLLEQQMQQ